MILFNRLALYQYGIDVYVFNAWRGIYFHWQRPLLDFGIINSHRKGNTLHEYGVVVFGLWLAFKLDT